MAPLGFGLLIEPLGRGVVAVSSILSLSALIALMLLPRAKLRREGGAGRPNRVKRSGANRKSRAGCSRNPVDRCKNELRDDSRTSRKFIEAVPKRGLGRVCFRTGLGIYAPALGWLAESPNPLPILKVDVGTFSWYKPTIRRGYKPLILLPLLVWSDNPFWAPLDRSTLFDTVQRTLKSLENRTRFVR